MPSDILKLEIDDVPIYEPDLDQSDMCSTSVSEDYNENHSNHLSPIQIIEFNHSCNDPIKRIGALSLEERKIKVEKYKDKRQKRR